MYRSKRTKISKLKTIVKGENYLITNIIFKIKIFNMKKDKDNNNINYSINI